MSKKAYVLCIMLCISYGIGKINAIEPKVFDYQQATEAADVIGLKQELPDIQKIQELNHFRHMDQLNKHRQMLKEAQEKLKPIKDDMRQQALAGKETKLRQAADLAIYLEKIKEQLQETEADLTSQFQREVSGPVSSLLQQEYDLVMQGLDLYSKDLGMPTSVDQAQALMQEARQKKEQAFRLQKALKKQVEKNDNLASTLLQSWSEQFEKAGKKWEEITFALQGSKRVEMKNWSPEWGKFSNDIQLNIKTLPGAQDVKRQAEKSAGNIMSRISAILSDELPEPQQKLSWHKRFKACIHELFADMLRGVTNERVTQHYKAAADLLAQSSDQVARLRINEKRISLQQDMAGKLEIITTIL